MSKLRYKVFAAALIILEQNDKILLMKRTNTGFEDGNFSLPSGYIEEGETAVVAAARELEEETGLVIKPEQLTPIHIMHRKSTDGVWADFFFLAKKWQAEPKIMEPEKCSEIGWFEINNLPSNTIPFIKQAIDSWQKGVNYSEFGW